MNAATFADLWPPERRTEVLKILSGISFHRGGTEMTNPDAVKGICVFDNAPLSDVLKNLGVGFEHIVQKERPDFAFALLSAALIKKAPKAFHANPFPFIFRSFDDGLGEVKPTTASISWTKPWSKYEVIDQIMATLEKTRARAYRDVVISNIDELLTNAAPEDDNATTTVAVTLAFAADRLACVVRDNHKNFSSKSLRERLWDLSLKKKWTPRPGEGGAGLGISLMLQNSTDYYLCHSKGAGSMACFLIDVRKGLRDLETQPKNAHILEC